MATATTTSKAKKVSVRVSNIDPRFPLVSQLTFPPHTAPAGFPVSRDFRLSPFVADVLDDTASTKTEPDTQ